MSEALQRECDAVSTPRDILLCRVLRRSLVQPTGKTYFNEDLGQFVVVEPHLTRADLEEWQAIEAQEARRGIKT